MAFLRQCLCYINGIVNDNGIINVIGIVNVNGMVDVNGSIIANRIITYDFCSFFRF